VSFAFVKENEDVSAIMVSLYENIPYILYVFTKKNNIGRGLATRLIRKSLYELDRKGYRRVQLSVSEANHGARFLYEKLGFKYKSIS
jgi:ribosomal protein S18 acetylase RimI-like enzyme